jgi:hypothetical protein
MANNYSFVKNNLACGIVDLKVMTDVLHEELSILHGDGEGC